MRKISHLLPELRKWNNGQGVGVANWLMAIARSDVALAYLDIFWPTFVEVEGYILRSGINRASLYDWESTGKYPRRSIECVLNRVHVVDEFTMNSREDEELRIARCKIIGQIMQEMYRVKLMADFPDRSFDVFLDGIEPSPEFQPITLTFCQA